MFELLLKLLGVWTGKAERIVKIVPTFHGDIAPFWIVFLALVVAVGAFWLYHKTADQVAARLRYTLAALRAIFLILIILILIRPVLSVTVAGSIRQSLLLLIDSSASMRIEDIRNQSDDLKRAAIAKGLIDVRGGLGQNLKSPPASVRNPSRLDLTKAVLTNDRLNLLKKLARDYDLYVYSFDRESVDIPIGKQAKTELKSEIKNENAPATQTAEPEQRKNIAAAEQTDWIKRLQANGSVTALGDSVRDTILRKRGQPVAGILVISDFAGNAGSLPLDAARMAKEENVPLYTYGVGITSPKDIIVGTIFAPETAFVRDEVSATVRVHSQGMKGEVAKLNLKLNGKLVDSKDVTFEADGEQVVSLKFTPQNIGEFNLTASIDPRDDEVVKDNNVSLPWHLRVIDGRIKVLHIEETPRWEYKYLQALLMRDRRVEYKTILFDADPSVVDVPNSPYLKQFPNMGELTAKYDVIILGDVDPKKLTPLNINNIADFVSRAGGSIIITAGRQYMPSAYRKTPIEKMLPVEFETVTMDSNNRAVADRPVKLELTPAGKSNSMLKLSDKELENLTKWSQLPPIYWAARVSRSKPAAEVLLVDADPAKASRFGKMPVVALQQYGLGQVLYFGTDNTWRWRRNLGESTFITLWSQTIERLSLPHMLGAAKRTQLMFDRDKYASGDRVTVYARLYREKDFEPITEPIVKAYYQPATITGSTTSAPATSDSWVGVGRGVNEREVQLRALPDQPGMYRAEFIVPEAGSYRFRSETDNNTALNFVVSEPRLEMGETALNQQMMLEMAAQSGGLSFREEDLYKLPDLVRNTSQPVLSKFEVELWSSPLYYIVLVLVAAVEWWMRKMSYLK